MAVWIGALSIIALVLTFLKDASKPNASGRRKWDLTISLAFTLLLVNTGVDVAKRIADSKTATKTEQQRQQIRTDIQTLNDSTISALDRLSRVVGSLPKERAENVTRDAVLIRSQLDLVNETALTGNLDVSTLAQIRDSIKGVKNSINRLQDQVGNHESGRYSGTSPQSGPNNHSDLSDISSQQSISPQGLSGTTPITPPDSSKSIPAPIPNPSINSALPERTDRESPQGNFDVPSENAVGACDERLSWARERMYPGRTKEELRLVYQWLKNSTYVCSNSADLWYYRALAARKIDDAKDRAFSARKAAELGSKALDFDPFSSAVTPNILSPAVYDKWAVIIGVSGLASNPDSVGFHASDATMLEDGLVRESNFRRDHTWVITGKDATTSNIRSALENVKKRAKPDDLVLVYINSHGVPRNLSPAGLSYILTYDTDTSNNSKLFATALQAAELAEFGRTTNAGAFVLLLDTCLAGTVHPDIADKIEPEWADDFAPIRGLQAATNRVAIAACRATEQSYTETNDHHGYFTHYLVEALGHLVPQKPVSSVFEYVRSHVIFAVKQQYNRSQHPEIQRPGAGNDIDLSVRASAP